MKTSTWSGVFALALMTSTAQAAVIFQDDFNSEGIPGTSSLNYNSFANWSVSGGTVDLVNTGHYSIDCMGGTGKCVDLDGSTGNAGVFTSTALTLDPGDYLLSFSISGNQRGGRSDALAVSLGGFFDQDYLLLPADPWMTVTHAFSVGASTTNAFIFNHAGGDNIGIILDDVMLETVDKVKAVPEPATLAFLGMAVFGLGMSRRKVF